MAITHVRQFFRPRIFCTQDIARHAMVHVATISTRHSPTENATPSPTVRVRSTRRCPRSSCVGRVQYVCMFDTRVRVCACARSWKRARSSSNVWKSVIITRGAPITGPWNIGDACVECHASPGFFRFKGPVDRSR